MRNYLSIPIILLSVLSSYGQSHSSALQRVNTYLEGFDNGYYGPLEVSGGYLRCNIHDGRQSRIPIASIDQLVRESPTRIKIKCKTENCVTGVTGDLYDQMSFSSNDAASTEPLFDLLKELVDRLKNTVGDDRESDSSDY